MLTHLGTLSSSVPSHFESLHLTQDSATADPIYSLRHGDVRIGKPREFPRFSSRVLLIRRDRLVALSGHFFECMKATYHPPGIAQRSASAEKHAHMVLAVEARESSNIQDKLGVSLRSVATSSGT